VVFVFGPQLILAAFQMLAGLLVAGGALLGFVLEDSLSGAVIGGGLGFAIVLALRLAIAAPFLLPGAALGYGVYRLFDSSGLGIILGIVMGVIVTGIVLGVVKALGPYFFLLFWSWVSTGVAEQLSLYVVAGRRLSQLWRMDVRLSDELYSRVDPVHTLYVPPAREQPLHDPDLVSQVVSKEHLETIVE
jgi:hypothetical protein